MYKFKKELSTLYLMIIPLMLYGCSYQYMDKKGIHHILGFGSVVVSTQKNEACSVETVTVTTLGVGVVNLPSHGGFTIGYVKNSSTQVPLFSIDAPIEKNLRTESTGDQK